MSDLSLDQLYKMVAHIYREQNANRSVFATFSHFVEVSGMLTVHDRKKKREGASVEDALCKALGWYFPLMAKFRIQSIEEVIFRKFPYVCPYCRLAPHQDQPCKQVKGTSSTVDHDALRKKYEQNLPRKPKSLNGWQKMFQDIYPRSVSEAGRSTIGLLEELGELAEAVRVYEQHPKYLLGEVADTFSYLMGIANEYQIQIEMAGEEFSFQDEFIKRYPGLCPQCGSSVCICPSVPASTVGRMAKELDISDGESLFFSDPAVFSADGQKAAALTLDQAGGVPGLIKRFPFDRGDANKALLHLCLRLAAAMKAKRPEIADSLSSAALRIGSQATYAGSPDHNFDDVELLTILRETWREIGEETKKEILSENVLANELGEMIGRIRVLFVASSPLEDDMLRVANEQKEVMDAIRRSQHRDLIEIVPLVSPTADDLRRALLENEFEIIHLSGHSDAQGFLLHSTSSNEDDITFDDLRELFARYGSIRCVVLNSCDSAKGLMDPIAPVTIGMEDSISDEGAISFSKGFYDAIGAGKDFDYAVEEGKSSAKLDKNDIPKIHVIKK